MQKLAVPIFLVLIEIAFPAEIYGISTSPPISMNYLQDFYNKEINAALSRSIFVKDSKLNFAFKNTDIGTFANSGLLANSSINTNPIPGEGTPKTAVFCRFENTLWRTFGIGVRLRVENAVFDH